MIARYPIDLNEDDLFLIVKHLVTQGCKFEFGSIYNPFFHTPNGNRCYLFGTFDLTRLPSVLNLPETIVIGKPRENFIMDQRSNGLIRVTEKKSVNAKNVKDFGFYMSGNSFWKSHKSRSL